MDVSSQEVEIQNSGYGHGHGHGHVSPVVVVPHNNNMMNNGTHTSDVEEEEEEEEHEMVPYKKQQQVKYRECLKNHAASMGGSATDGCGEFMPSGEEGSIEALNCSACNCHRNFHRKEIEGQFFIQQHPSLCHETFYNNNHNNNPLLNRVGRKVILNHHPNPNNHKTSSPDHTLGYPTRLPHQMILPYNFGVIGGGGGGGGGGGSLPSESDEQDQDVNCVGHVVMARPPPLPLPLSNHHLIHHQHHLVKKRFRTKFSQEQKDKMLEFAEKVGWKIQKQEDCVVQQLCQEIGVKRRVLKVWMHNNKHNLAKNNHIDMDHPSTTTTTTTTTIIPQHHPN